MNKLVKILLVDDDNDTRKPIKALLEKKGFSVHDASNGLEGIDRFKSFRPDIVIMDSIMPEMEGSEATRKILDIDPQAKVILLTGRSDIDIVEAFDQVGARYFLSKPIDSKTLLEAIDTVLAIL